jgi:hypothetical protein
LLSIHVLHRHRRPRARRAAAALALTGIVALALGWHAPLALADGDPASDVLVSQSVFVPFELTINRETDELQALLAAADRAGFPIRVALIDSPQDLGTVTALWRQPLEYSRYLGTELSLSFGGQVAVVMPNGIGIDPGTITPTAAERAVAARLPAPGGGAALVGAAIEAVQRLAAAEGHPLPAPLRASGPPPAPTGGQNAAWLALVLGAALVALAWAASLRARPLRLRRRAAA